MTRLRLWRQWLRDAGSLRVWVFYLPGPGPMLMSWLRKRWVIWRNPRTKITFEGPVYLGPGFSLDSPRGGTFTVGPGVEFRRNFRAELAGPEAVIRIGTMSVFTYDVLIQCSSLIDIGAHCMFGQSTLVVDGNHRFRDLDTPMLQQGYDLREIHLEDHVTTTTKCSIMASIGTRTFLGANSVVTSDLPPYCIAVGAPAKPIEFFGPPDGQPAQSPR